MFATLLARWKLYAVVAGLVAAVIGYAWWEGGSSERAKRRTAEGVITQQQEAAERTADAIDNAAKTDADIAARDAAESDRIDRIKEELRKHDPYYRAPVRKAPAVQPRADVPERKPPNVQPAAETPGLVAQGEPRTDHWLTVGTVRLLNLAALPDAAGRAVDRPAEGSDEESRAPSAVTTLDQLEWTLEVIRQYHRLAIRHDELVDYVQGLVDEQRRRLKLPEQTRQP